MYLVGFKPNGLLSVGGLIQREYFSGRTVSSYLLKVFPPSQCNGWKATFWEGRYLVGLKPNGLLSVGGRIQREYYSARPASESLPAGLCPPLHSQLRVARSNLSLHSHILLNLSIMKTLEKNKSSKTKKKAYMDFFFVF